MDIVLLFPGQGSQKPGMGRDLAEAHPAAHDVFATVDHTLGVPLSRLMFDGPVEELTLTHNAQPALLAHGAALWAVVRERIAPRVRAAAGHSLGEFTAHYAAGSLTLPEAARLVRRRGQLMYETGVQRPGAMAAILGDLSRPIEDICHQASEESGLCVPANYNSPGQVVISGDSAGVERGMALCKDAGAKRAIALNVSGAFHSPLMEPAVAGLAEGLEGSGIGAPAFPVYANVDASAVRDAATASALLLRQLTSPVRWIQVVEALAAAHPEALFVEMGPGSVLVGLVKKIAPQLQSLACGTVADVDALLARVG